MLITNIGTLVTNDPGLGTLHDAAIVPVSAYTGAGVPGLVACITALLHGTPRRPDLQQPRLPIDRVFSITGFGTVVTGTLTGGSLKLGDEIELQPTGARGRVRGLQSYKQAVELAAPGSRVAVNIAGIERQLIARGQVLTRPGLLRPTTLVDLRFRHLPKVDRPLKHNAEVKLFVGAAETTGRVRLLDDEFLRPGHEGWIQMRLDAPLALAYGDRFILRYPSPAQTIGGGLVVNPHPEKRWRRFQPAVVRDLETRMLGTPAERVAQAADGLEPVTRDVLRKRLDYPPDALQAAIADALYQGLLIEMADGLLIAASSINRTLARMAAELRAFHRAQPLRPGMPREALRSRLGVKNATLTAMLERQRDIVAENTLLRLSDHAIRLTPAQESKANRLREAMQSYIPPSYDEAVRTVGEDVLHALIDIGEIVQIAPDVLLSREIYSQMVTGTLAAIDASGSVTVATVRDQFNTSRKYALALLEYLDALGVTRREGDARVRGRAAPTN